MCFSGLQAILFCQITKFITDCYNFLLLNLFYAPETFGNIHMLFMDVRWEDLVTGRYGSNFLKCILQTHVTD